MIVRAERPESQYLIVRNEVARDERLSHRARGILLDILSRPDNWETSAERMMSEGTVDPEKGDTIGKEGREAILTAFRELRNAGYMRTVKRRNEKGQLVSKTLVFDAPQHPQLEPRIEPESGEPESADPIPAATRENALFDLVEPETAQPGSADPTPLKEPPKNNQKTNYASDPSFIEFWAVWPRKRDVSKAAAFTSWRREVVRDGPGGPTVVGAARLYAAEQQRKGTADQYIAHPSTWLNQRRWETILEEEPEAPREWRGTEDRQPEWV